MKILKGICIILAAAAAGLATGFVSRHRVAEPAAPQAAIGSANRDVGPSRPTQSAGARAARLTKNETPLVTQLAADLSMSSSVTQWLLWMEALEKAAPSDFPGLARLAASSTKATRLVAAKWVEVSPRDMFDYVMALTKSGGNPSELSGVLMEEWPKRDMDGVIAAMSDTNNATINRNWRRQVAGSVFEKDVERGLKLFSEWNIDNYGPRMTAVKKWAADNPRHAAEFALANPAGYASQSVMETIAKEWAKANPAEALGWAITQRGQLSGILAKTALKEWAGRDLENAAQWLGGVDAASRERLSAPFVEAWAKKDPAAALAWCEQSLTGSSQAQAIAGAVKTVAGQNAAAAAELVSALGPSPSRAAAAAAVAEKWFPSYGSDKPISGDALAWVAKLDAESTRKVLEQTQWSWAERDPVGMAKFIGTLQSEQVPDNSYNYIARSMARKNPAEALEWAKGLPEEHRVAAACDAFGEWQRAQPEQAKEWLSDLPRTDPRRESLFQSAVAILAHSPDAEVQLASFNATDRTAAARLINDMRMLPEDRRAKLLQALK